MLTQREHDIARLEAELKMARLFDEWRKAFLAERAIMELIQQQQANMQPMPPMVMMPGEEEGGAIR